MSLRKKSVRIILGLVLTGTALWLSFKNLDWRILEESFLQINFIWILLGLMNIILTVYALGLRWQILLKPEGKIPLSSLFRLNIISQYINIIMPARLGELARSYLASKRYGLSGTYVLGTVFLEKILDFFVFVSLWVFVPSFFALQEKVRGYEAALVLCLFVLALLIVLVWKPSLVLRGVRLFSRLLPEAIRQKAVDYAEKGVKAFDLLKDPRALLSVILYTFLFVGGQVFTIFMLFQAFGIGLSFWAGLVVLLAIQVGNIPPSTPGKVGIHEYATILALSLFGVDKNLALSFGIVLHIVSYLPKIILGFFFLLTTDITLKKEALSLKNSK
jgi:uncharacterized protein (TIRG00374 family)